ncbi:hypothetical protein [Rhizobium sp. 11515TR]|uniref:hypothetical protein n=1 Tax=Rhizobium sp. 11515TR TaxID=2028343 RepID=UPI000BA8358F|nr:hypothetical protein [Rhizobium sp. 11515TR]ASW04720.1 hypothetical protein CKA34_01555 [Rhizobium sp. 11515TR]
MTGNWKLRLRDRKEDFVAIFVVAGAKQFDLFDAVTVDDCATTTTDCGNRVPPTELLATEQI